MKGLFELRGVYCAADVDEAKRIKTERMGIKEVPFSEARDLSYLISDEYVNCFNNPNIANLDVLEEVKINYSPLMRKFKDDVLKAYMTADLALAGDKPIWAKMRDKYYSGKPYVYADEMIDHISEFDCAEIVAFLHYSMWYKERFCDGSYAMDARDGYI